MSASNDLYEAVAELLGQEGALRVNVPIVQRRTKDLKAEIDAAAANHGLCIWVKPPLPMSALQGAPFVFFDKVEIRIRIVEQTAMNSTGADAYDLVDDVANALQWQPRAVGKLSAILSHPLELAARPVEVVDDPNYRVLEVILEAVFGFAPAE